MRAQDGGSNLGNKYLPTVNQKAKDLASPIYGVLMKSMSCSMLTL